ncbi:MAG TPA: methylamine utilization protein [Gammaproteobacteria bacterium]|nr:methylamine utilization protein [Gammaproteobacteria bacterium]
MQLKIITLAAVLTLAGGIAHGATVLVTVDADGHALPAAVVALESIDGAPIPPPSGAHLTGVMDQHDRQFVPHVLAVEAGTAVQFPNSDNIRHDVYSFSPAKVFELPLYAGTPAQPVIFDKPGVVVLGCNIHDWMLAFIDVVPTPYFGQTDAGGAARIEDVPAGRYKLTVWAPRIQAPQHTLTEQVEVTDGQFVRHYSVTLGPEPAHVHRHAESSDSGALEKLQRKFGRFRQNPP